MITQELDLFLSSLPVLLWNEFYELAQMQGAQMSLQKQLPKYSPTYFCRN
jgi:hypothetical protein